MEKICMQETAPAGEGSKITRRTGREKQKVKNKG
jgi:hypothetical protein